MGIKYCSYETKKKEDKVRSQNGWSLWGNEYNDLLLLKNNV